MTQTQKIIKYAAIAFAIFLIISIFSTIINLISFVINTVSPDNSSEAIKETYSIEVSESKNIELELKSISLTVKRGDSFKASTNSDNIKVIQNKNGKLKIIEKNHFDIISINKTSEILVLEIPESFELDEFDLEAGAGIININGLTAQSISFELGAGEVTVSELYVKKDADIDGGAGKLTIEGTIGNLDLDMGIGELNLNARFTSQSEINCGVGNANITLIGNKEDYKLNINKGIGTVKVDGSPLGDYKVSAKPNAVKVNLDCGVGNINIDFE